MTDEAVDPETLLAVMAKFADDTKIARITETEEDIAKMQEIIDRLARWAKKWEMTFNAGKCKIMHFGNRNPQATYSMEEVELGTTQEERDLGIKIVNNLKPSRQCATVAKSAHFALSQIQRAFHFRRKRDLIPLYTTFVRPKLEFGVAAWCPWTEADAKELEKVQERLIRMVSDVSGSSYEEKLKDAGLTTLKERRVRGDAIEVFKAIRQISRVEVEKWFSRVRDEARPLRSNTVVDNGDATRRVDLLEPERANLELRRNFFTVRAVKVWNELPDAVKNQKSVNAFKNAYDAWRRNEPLSIIETAVEQESETDTERT